MKSQRAFNYLLASVAFLSIYAGTLEAQAWESFRAAYPYHIQTVALSDEDAQHHRTLIISEPPPFLSLADIQRLDPLFQSAVTKTQSIGVDGWVKDAVIDLPPVPPEVLPEVIDRLQLRLFGTTYKTYVTPIPSGHESEELSKLNLHINSGDLKAWLLGVEHTVDWVSIAEMFAVAAVLMLLALASFASKKIAVGLLLLGVAIYIMFSNSPLLTLACIGFVFACLALARFRKSESMQGLVYGLAALALFAFPLHRWWADNQGPVTSFKPLFGDKVLSCASLLKEHKTGVFLSTTPGIVLWSVPRSTPIEKYATDFREFALDSDLILGAIATSDQIAILGRERTAMVNRLPPLRIETALLLADTREDELSQSYERKNALAGRYDAKAHMDWAPIYLSPRLVDSEYGSLLNITDQLLKGWSMHDKIHYVNFKYPKPSVYPFSDDLMSVLGTQQLTFNWNTKGAGYVTQSGSYEIYALNRTGSLPIDYLAKGKPDVEGAEDTAYNYYSKTNDPNLIRVVQYAALYQIFHHFGIAGHVAPPSTEGPGVSPLIGRIKDVLQEIRGISDATLSRVAANDRDHDVEEVRAARDDLRRIATMPAMQNTLVAALASRDGMQTMEAISDISQRRLLESAFGEVQDVAPHFISEEDRQFAMFQFEIASMARQSQWVHTPSIVESQGTATGIGGHNLSAAITEFEADANVSAGRVSVEEANGKRVIHYNPSDEGKIGNTVRDAARKGDESSSEVESAVQTAMRAGERAPASLGEGLGFDAEIKPSPMRGFQPPDNPTLRSRVGWSGTGRDVASADVKILKEFSTDRTRAVLVARYSDGTYVISAPPAKAVQAMDLASSTDAFLSVSGAGRGEKVAVHFRGFDDRQAEGFMRNLEPRVEEDPVVATAELPALSDEELAAILSDRYDVSRARVIESKSITLKDGSAGHQLAVEIPARTSGVKTLVVELQLRMKNALEFTQDFLSHLSDRITAILSGLQDEPDIRVISATLVRELRKDRSLAEVSARIRRNDETLLYVQNKERYLLGKETRRPA